MTTIQVLELTLQNTRNTRDMEDIVTNDTRGGVLFGYQAGYQRLGYNLTLIGYQAGHKNIGDSNTFVGASAMYNNENGRNNTALGAFAGFFNQTGQNNTFIGPKTGYFNKTGSENIYQGTSTALYNNGNFNIMIGNQINNIQSASNFNKNISIGYKGTTLGNVNISLGNESVIGPKSTRAVVIGHNSVNRGFDSMIFGNDSRIEANTIDPSWDSTHSNIFVFGHGSVNSGANSIIMGNNITNHGSNAFVVMTFCNANSRYINTESDIVNINNKFKFGLKDTDKLTLNFGNAFIGDPNNYFQLSNDGSASITGKSNVTIFSSNLVNLSNDHAWINILPGSLYMYGSNSIGLFNHNNLISLNSNGTTVGFSNNEVRTGLSATSNSLMLYGFCNKVNIESNGITIKTAQGNQVLVSDSNTSVTGDFVAKNNLYVDGTAYIKFLSAEYTEFQGGASFTSSIYTKCNLDAEGHTTLNTLDVKGIANFMSNVSFNQNIQVDGNSLFNSNMRIKGDLFVEGNIYGSSSLTLSNNLYVVQDVKIGSNMELFGIGKFSSNVYMEDDLTISSNLLVKGDSFVAGTASFLDDVNVNSNLDVHGHVNLNNEVFINDTLQVQGASIFESNVGILNDAMIQGSLYALSNAFVNSNLFVLNKSSFCNDIEIAGTSYFLSSVNMDSSLKVEGSTSFRSNVDILQHLYVHGNTDIGSNLSVYGVLFAHDGAQVSKNLYVDGNTLIDGRLIVDNTSQFNGHVFVQSNITFAGFASFCNNVDITSNLTIQNNLEIWGNTVLSSNLEVGGNSSFDSNIKVYGNGFFHSNLFIDSNLIVHGTSTFDNIVYFKDGFISNSVGVFNSNVEISGDLNVNGLIRGQIEGLSNYVIELIQGYGGTIGGIITGCNYNHSNCAALLGESLTTLETDVYINSNLHVEGEICARKLSIQSLAIQNMNLGGDVQANTVVVNSNLVVEGPSTLNGNISTDGSIQFNVDDYWWRQYIEYVDNSVDLVFVSRGGTKVIFTDEFSAETLNFTGKHRCAISKRMSRNMKNLKSFDDYIGKIVISNGEYMNLNNESTINIDEAIPVVDICQNAKDQRAFGVIGGFDAKGCFKIGNMQFQNIDKYVGVRAIIQNVGEGALWVTSYNGNLKNGDYITTSPISGLGMKQDEEYRAKYTIAKITCDCDFNIKSKVYKCKEFLFQGKKYKKAFVGCIYYF